MIGDQIALLGARVTEQIEAFGRFTRFAGATLMWLAGGLHKRSRWRLLVPQLFEVGTRSIPVVMVVGGFVGMVLAIEAYDQFAQIGQQTRLGGIIDISVVRQIGPVLAAVMIAGRVGGAFSAELGTMRVTEQIDAMRVMGTDPVAYLVVPRVIACLAMVPVLTVISDLVGILGGYLVSVKAYGINGYEYRQFASEFVWPYDVISGLVKSMIFGGAIGLISCYKGFNCRGGAEGVGRAATEAFVVSFLAIIVANFFLAKLLKDLFYLIYGYGASGSAFG